MLYKKMFPKIIIIAVICMAINGTLIYAADEENVDSSSDLKIYDEQYTPKVTDAEYASIEKILEYINKELKNIDEKVDICKTLPEYEKYPAVRLNIDTPYFGIKSIISSKLKIRDNVSTVDVANGYSIESVVNRKVIKIESFQVSNVVVITRDLNIDKTMSESDAKTCIFKLLNYLSQVKSVNKFVDIQLSGMITGYFSNEKTTVISNINEQINEIEENLDTSLEELSYINALTEVDITEDTNTLYKYRDEMTSIKSIVKNTLTSKEKLDVIYTNILKTNENIKLFRFNVNKRYLDVTNSIDIEKAVNLVTSKMNNELTYLQSYIDNAKIKSVNQVTIDTSTSTPLASGTATNEIKYTEVYKTASVSIIENMKKDIDKVKVISDKIAANKLITDEATKTKEKLDTKALTDELLKIYIAFLNKENVFLTENSKVNITEIKKSNEINITSFEDVIYIYINISDVLTNISDNFESNSIISNIKTAESLKQVIKKVILSGNNLKKQVTSVQ